MWSKIKYLTTNSERTSLKTIDIPIDTSMKWKEIMTIKRLQFTTIDDQIVSTN